MQWTGAVAGPEGCIDQYGADDAFPIDDLDEIVPELLAGKSAIHFPVGV